jgi:hypothetical protein
MAPLWHALVTTRYLFPIAGVAQRQSRWLPPRRCGFDSRCPLHFSHRLPSSSGPPAFQAVRRGFKSRRQDQFPLRLTAGHCTLNAGIVVRAKTSRCSSAEERRSHTAKVGCSNQPTGTIPAVVQRSERLNVNQEVGGSTPPPGTTKSLSRNKILWQNLSRAISATPTELLLLSMSGGCRCNDCRKRQNESHKISLVLHENCESLFVACTHSQLPAGSPMVTVTRANTPGPTRRLIESTDCKTPGSDVPTRAFVFSWMVFLGRMSSFASRTKAVSSARNANLGPLLGISR